MSPLKIILLVITVSVAANAIFYSFLFLTKPTTEPQTLIHIPRVACDPDSGTSAPVITRVIIAINNTVTWKNWGSCAHTIVGDTETFRSEVLSQNQTWSYTFEKEGIYHYHTEPSVWLKGNIVALSESSAEKIVIYDQNPRFANINDIEPNSAYIFLYPMNRDDAWNRWLLIRLPESLGGDKNYESALRAYSMVDIRLHCLVQYFPEKLQMSEPCHGSFYDLLNGVAITGPAVDYNFPNNALPRLELLVDGSGFIYVKPAEFTVEGNGKVGYGRIPDLKSIQLGNREIPVEKPKAHKIPEKLQILKTVKGGEETEIVDEYEPSLSPIQAIDKVLLSTSLETKTTPSELQKIVVDKIEISYQENEGQYLIPYYNITGRMIVIMPNEEITFVRTLKAVDYKIPTTLRIEVYPGTVYGNFDNLAVKGFLRDIDNHPVRFATIMVKFNELYFGITTETDRNGCFYYNMWNKNFVRKTFDEIREKEGTLLEEANIEILAYESEDYHGASASESIQLSAMPQIGPTINYLIDLLDKGTSVQNIGMEKNQTIEFELRVEELLKRNETIMLTTKNVPCDIEVDIIPEIFDLQDGSTAKGIFRMSSHADKLANYKIAILATNEKGHLFAREWVDVRVLP